MLTTLLLLFLIRRGAVAEVTTLFNMVPAVTALITFAFFGEALAPVQILGMAVAMVGVFLARTRAAGESARRRRRRSADRAGHRSPAR